MSEAAARSLFQLSTGLALLLFVIAGIIWLQAKRDKWWFGPDHPDAITKQGDQYLEAKRQIIASGYQQFIIRWLVRLGIASAVVAIISLPIFLSLR
jgi:hypothetical protein